MTQELLKSRNLCFFQAVTVNVLRQLGNNSLRSLSETKTSKLPRSIAHCKRTATSAANKTSMVSQLYSSTGTERRFPSTTVAVLWTTCLNLSTLTRSLRSPEMSCKLHRIHLNISKRFFSIKERKIWFLLNFLFLIALNSEEGLSNGKKNKGRFDRKCKICFKLKLKDGPTALKISFQPHFVDIKATISGETSQSAFFHQPKCLQKSYSSPRRWSAHQLCLNNPQMTARIILVTQTFLLVWFSLAQSKFRFAAIQPFLFWNHFIQSTTNRCDYSKRILAEFKKVELDLKGKNLDMVVTYCNLNGNKPTCRAYDVTSYPQIGCFNKGKWAGIMPNKRGKANEISKYISGFLA